MADQSILGKGWVDYRECVAGISYMMNVCLGGLQAISGEYYEAAKMDGASKFQCFKSITLPMVTKLSIPLVISSFAANFNNFGNIYMITQGGPASG